MQDSESPPCIFTFTTHLLQQSKHSKANSRHRPQIWQCLSPYVCSISSLRAPRGSRESGCEATILVIDSIPAEPPVTEAAALSPVWAAALQEHQLISDASGAEEPSTIITEQENKQVNKRGRLFASRLNVNNTRSRLKRGQL